MYHDLVSLFIFYTLRWFGDSETRQYEGSLFSQHHGQHPAPPSFYPLVRTPKVPAWRDSSLWLLPHHRIFPSKTSGSEPKTTVSLKTVVCGRRVLPAPCLVLIRTPRVAPFARVSHEFASSLCCT